jgi:hypothetical protein
MPTSQDIFSNEDGGSMFLQNTGIYLQRHMESQPRGSTLTGTTVNSFHCSGSCFLFQTE